MATQKIQDTPPNDGRPVRGGFVAEKKKQAESQKNMPRSVTKPKDEPKNKPKPSVTAPVEPVPEVPVDWETAAKEQYGGYYAIIQGVPELTELIKNAVSQKYSNSQFTYELQQTNWYKTTSASTRTWDTNKQLDPASAQQQIDTRSASIREAALNLGVNLDDATIAKLSEDSLRGNWDQQILNNSIGAEASKTSAGMSGLRTGFLGQQLKQTAIDYGVQLSDQTFNMWVEKVARGEENAKSFQQYALNTAKALFPSITTQLDQGLTFQQITDPYKQTAARTLEINPDTIDFTDPKWSKAITFSTDKGEQRPMNSNEWGNYLRSERSLGYEYTNEARSRAYQVTSGLANLFGKI
jgi:hypothetical protein